MYPTEEFPFPEVLLRLVMAMLLGGAIGVNRDLHHKPAGLRVLALVSIGSALAAMVMLTLSSQQSHMSYDGLSRVFQGILQGIGFLGAGVIMRAQGRDEIHGLTTAASVWFTAVLGVACGIGMWKMAVASVLVAFTILTVGRSVERLILLWRPIPENDSVAGTAPPAPKPL